MFVPFPVDSPASASDEGGMTQADPAPRDFQTLKSRIVERAPELPKRLSQVAAYAVENPDEVAFGTAASIAEAADVQPSTLVRFSQAMGYQGFSELQEVFRSRLRERVPNYEERLAQLRQHALSASQPLVLFQGFSEAAQKSLASLADKLDSQQMEAAVAALADAETIYLIGLRRSFPVTSYMAYAMGKLGIRNVLVDALAGLAQEQLGFASQRDAVFAVSFTPYASETVALARAAADRGIPMVAVTDSPFSPLAKIASLWIEVAEANFEGFRSMAATMTLATTLAVAIAEKRGSR
jgi:DNA-binding MurR/RpiR family transcriptional regulator